MIPSKYRKLLLPALTLCLALTLTGCQNKTDQQAKPAKDDKGQVEDVHSQGPHGGHKFHFASGHDVLAEIVFAKDPRTIELYLIDHENEKQGVIATDNEITLTGLKHDGEDLPDVTLTAQPLEGEQGGSSHFIATGDAVPAEIDDEHALNGATFTATIDGKKRTATITLGEEAHH